MVANKNPKRYPPVGPNNTVNPDVPLENTGNPIAPSSKYSPTVGNEIEIGILNAITIRNKLCKVKGTVENGKGIDINADIDNIAANNDITIILLIGFIKFLSNK